MQEHTSNANEELTSPNGGFFESDFYLTWVRPSVSVAYALMLIVAAKLCHAGTLVAILGAVCIILLTVSKIYRLQTGIFLSMVSLLLMVMVNLWHWADVFFIAVYSGNIVTDKSIFTHALVEGVIIILALWYDHRLLKNLHMRITHEWYVKKSQLKFLELLIVFQLFLLFFLTAGFIEDAVNAGTHYDPQDTTVIAGVIALVASMVPAFLYFYRNRGHESSHRHRRHHRHN